MEDFACPSSENVSPITDLSRNLTTLRTLGDTWVGTPQMPSALKKAANATPDTAGSFRLKTSFTPGSDCGSESEAEPSPLTVNLHRRVILAQVNKSINHESPFFINRVTPSSSSRRFFKRPSLELKGGEEESSLRKNSSQGYCSSTSDGFALDEVGLDEDDNANKENREPADAALASLLSAPINVPVKDLCSRRVGPSARRNLSFNAGGYNNETPIKSKRSDDDDRNTKRTRLCLAERTNMPKIPKFYSESNIDREAAEDVIDKGAVEILPTIGAHKRCALPTISVQTLCDILNGKFDQVVNSFEIIDCRWPYEFDGGHIRGAKNLYTQEQIFKEYLENNHEESSENSDELVPSTSRSKKRDILIFHCEFSSERGPKMSQYLREKDRETNVYPKLHYPEVYILKGGYKEFFDSFRELCVPQEYMKMVDERHTDECRLYRSQSKSFEKKSFSRNQSSRF
ncbi:cdc25-like protein phosphatase twine [Galendromus occidentalis]|uniref:M-phase inducer phosphatase n=1 Tax=Galendromus occidentalis TaxID=34638 RepID=A0AAJ7SHU4_9ACAR|nr:cdc25-like protein phosphatase twine [Galendromus occidentalis]